MAGALDVQQMLAEMRVSIRDSIYCVVSVNSPSDELSKTAAATIVEDEGTTLILTIEQAEAHGLSHEFPAAWLTLDVHSSLDAIGLTAAVAQVLADTGIACNVLAGFYHDHLLVPADRGQQAKALLESLQ